jgi:hypothetical protein
MYFLGVFLFITALPLLIGVTYLIGQKPVFQDLSIGVYGGWLGGILLFYVGKWFLKEFCGSYYFPEGPPSLPYALIYLLCGLFLGGVSGVLSGVEESLRKPNQIFIRKRSLVQWVAGGALISFGISLLTVVFFLV